jgi:hypothetical protein
MWQRAHGGSIGLLVESEEGWKGGSRRKPEAAAEGSMTTAMLRRPMSARDLRVSISELWGRY